MGQTVSQFITALQNADEQKLVAFFDKNHENVGAVLFPESSREWRNYIGNPTTKELRDIFVGRLKELKTDVPDISEYFNTDDLVNQKQTKAPSVLGFLKRNWLATTGYGLVAAGAIATWVQHQELTENKIERDRIQEFIDALPMQAEPKLSYITPNGMDTAAPQRSHLGFSSEFNTPVLMGLPPTPNKETMESYAFNADSDIPLNPYLIKALEESADVREYLRLIKEASEAHDLDWRMATNQLFRESHHFNPDIITGKEVSAQGAIGFAQFKDTTAAEEYGLTSNDLLDPQTSIWAYAQHMRDLLNDYNDDKILALMAYNAGDGAVDWARKELKNPKATGQEVLAFLTQRHEDLGNTDPHAYHVETRKYINSILGLSDDEIDPSWQIQQNKKLNNPLFIAGLENESHVLSVAYPTYRHIDPATNLKQPSALVVTTSPRPVPRP